MKFFKKLVPFSQKIIRLHSIDFQQFENQNFEIFDEVLKNFGRSDVIKLKNNDFSLNAYLVSCPTCPKNCELYLAYINQLQ